MDNHDFCRAMLSRARQEARDNKIHIPSGITALRADKRQYFIESRSEEIQEYVDGDCAFEAKSNYIFKQIEKKGKA